MKFKGFVSFLVCCVSFIAVPANSITVDELLPNEKNTVEIFQKYSPKSCICSSFDNSYESFL